ncbi:MAG: rRNA pseudouridine synthase [Clostridia bacterium]|nr:rRNA pseudouridine synthase [Clostridia bacterium]
MRINRFLASCGIASRRKCDELISEGKVTVNEKKAESGEDIGINDVVRVDGQIVNLKDEEYYMVYKPKGYISSVSDEKGRKTVLDLLPKEVGRVYPVGRLDYESEGLLIMTTDGDLAQRLTHPSMEVPKTYVAKVEGVVNEKDLNPIRSGIEIEGKLTKKCKANIIETNKEYTKVKIVLKEGKNHEVRKMFKAIGHEVILLKRTKIGELTLSGLDRGQYRKLTREEVNYLLTI